MDLALETYKNIALGSELFGLYYSEEKYILGATRVIGGTVPKKARLRAQKPLGVPTVSFSRSFQAFPSIFHKKYEEIDRN